MNLYTVKYMPFSRSYDENTKGSDSSSRFHVGHLILKGLKLMGSAHNHQSVQPQNDLGINWAYPMPRSKRQSLYVFLQPLKIVLENKDPV